MVFILTSQLSFFYFIKNKELQEVINSLSISYGLKKKIGIK